VLRERSASDRIRIQVGSATCEHAAGTRDVLEEFRKHVVASGRDDILMHRTGCTGRCSREPIVGVLIPGQMPVKYQQVDRELVHGISTRHVLGGEPLLDHVLDGPVERIARYEILYCSAARCGWKGRELCGAVLPEKLLAAGLGPEQVQLDRASCFGACTTEECGKYAQLLVRPDKVLYRVQNEQDLDEII